MTKTSVYAAILAVAFAVAGASPALARASTSAGSSMTGGHSTQNYDSGITGTNAAN